MSTRRRSSLRLSLAAVAFAIASQASAAGEAFSIDCTKQPPAERLKCEQAVRVAAICGDFDGAARATCEKHYAESPSLDDCARLDELGRPRCETAQQSVLAEYPCAGKAGAVLAVCAREQAQKATAARLTPP